MLEIRNLKVSSGKKQIVNGISLKIKPSEVHALMGPNGSGKSSLALALAGHPQYKITSGKVVIDGKNITNLSPDKRAKQGLFLAMQHPVSISGVSVANFIRTSLKNQKKDISPSEFVEDLKNKMADLKIDESFASRGINDGFSGGEKKKMEVLQLSFLRPKYAVLDEVDSGLDIDSLRQVSKMITAISKLKTQNSKQIGILLITHYQRILEYMKPDFVHVMVDGEIVKSGTSRLVEIVDKKGYGGILK